MTAQQISAHQVPWKRLAAWSVHAYTAAGVVAAFAGAIAVFDGRYRTAFLMMVAATVLDATDGFLARAADVKRFTPGLDGARLDDIVDYVTFVFLPMLVVYRWGSLPARPGSSP